MGAWYDYLEKLPTPDHITITPEIKHDKKGNVNDVKLKVTLQYNKRKQRIKQVIYYLDEFSMPLYGVKSKLNVEKGEKWGDWGGPIKVGDVLYVYKERKFNPKNLPPEKVEFT